MQILGTPLDAALYHIWFSCKHLTKQQIVESVYMIVYAEIGMPYQSFTAYRKKIVFACENILRMYPSSRAFEMKSPVRHGPREVTLAFKQRLYNNPYFIAVTAKK